MEMNDYQTIAEAVPEESTAVTLLKALLGAVVGSLPAVFLWIVLGKAGYVAAIAGFLCFSVRSSPAINLHQKAVI